MENKEFAEYDEQESSDSVVRFYNDGNDDDDDDDDNDDEDEPEVAAGVIKEPKELLLPTIAKTVGKVFF